jgi:hypothetical protein
VARKQRGLATTAQLAAAGVSAGQRDRRVAAGQIAPVRRNVFRCLGVPADWETMVLAAVLTVGSGAVASSFTAARLWNFLDKARPVDPPGIHITSPRRVQARGIIHHKSELEAREMTRRHDVPVTSALRTIVDLATERSLTVDELGEIVDGALRRRLVRLPDLRRAVIQRGGRGRPSMSRLREVLATRGAAYEPGANDWERRMDEWWDAAGLPPARRQYKTRIGGHTYIIDRAIVDLRIAVEWNGYATHGQTRSGFDNTAVRQLALVGAGWAYIPVTTRTPLDAVCRAVWMTVSERSRAL